jgi:hypothetical protein
MPAPSIAAANTPVDPFEAANATVRAFCRWHVAPAIFETLTLDGSGSRTLLLPSKHVVALEEVLNEGVNVTELVDTSTAGILELTSGCWTSRLGRIKVTLLHGYNIEDVADVAEVIQSLAARAASVPAGIASQTIGPASVRYGTVPMLVEEQNKLEPYRLNWGA